MSKGRFDERGTIFITTVVSLFMMVLVGSSLFQLTSQDMFFIQRLKKSIQAKYLAEAGLAQALSNLKNNFQTSATYPTVNLAVGNYQASVSTASGRTLVTSTGAVQGITRLVSAEVVAPAASAFNYAIASGGSMALDSGTGQSPGTVNGNVYSQGSASIDGPSSGGVLLIKGNVHVTSSSLSVANSVTVTGQKTANYASSVPFPAVDLNFYKAIATANGQYFAGSKVYNAASPIPANPPGGVIYVGGSLAVYGTQTTNATLVTGGSFSIQKTGNNYPRVTVTKTDGLPAIVSKGSFAYQSSGNGGSYLTVTGLFYTGGSLSFYSGNHDTFTVNGSLVSLGSMNISPQSQNTLTINYIALNPPGFTIPPSQFGVESYNT